MTLHSHQIKYILSFFYIFSYFFYKARSPLPAFDFTVVTLPIELAGIFLAFILTRERGEKRTLINRKSEYAFFLFFIFITLFMHTLVLEVVYNDANIISRFVNLIRMSVYLFATAIFAKFYFDFKTFYKILFNFSLLTTLIVLVIRFINPFWFADVGYGVPRPLAFLSEPSAFGPVVTFLFFSSLLKRHWLGVLSSSLVIYFVSSGTVFIVFALTATAFLVALNKKNLLLFALLAVPLLIVGSSKVSILMENSYLLTRVTGAITETDVDGGEGGTARLITLFNLYSELSKDNRVYFGRGFNTAKIYFGEQWEYREFSLIHLFLFSFGLIGVVLLFILLSVTIMKVYKTKNLIFLIMFVSFVSSSLLNSAEGTILHKFAYLFVLVLFLNSSQLIENSNNSGFDHDR